MSEAEQAGQTTPKPLTPEEVEAIRKRADDEHCPTDRADLSALLAHIEALQAELGRADDNAVDALTSLRREKDKENATLRAEVEAVKADGFIPGHPRLAQHIEAHREEAAREARAELERVK